MAISINNGIANIDGTPGAISGVFSNRPAAADLANGTLYFSTDKAEIYQVVLGVWVLYSGGGGGTPGIDSVLSQGQFFSNDRVINVDNFEFLIENIKLFNLKDTTVNTEFKFSQNQIIGNITLSKSKALFLSIPYDSSWKLKVNGRETEVYIGNLGLMAIPLSEGTHKIELSFKPPYWNLSWVITVIGFILFVLVVILNLWINKNKKNEVKY